MRRFVFLVLLKFGGFASALCPAGSIKSSLDSSVCYKFIANKTEFMDAETMCAQNKGHLVSISSGFENAVVNDEARHAFGVDSLYFIGLNDLTKKGAWSWIDRSETSYTNWGRGQPTSAVGFDCATVDVTDGSWRSANCFDSRPFVCRVPQQSNACPACPTCQAPPAPTCPLHVVPTCPACPSPPKRHYCDDGWSPFQGNCYKLGDGVNQAFWNARQDCLNWGADLASIHSYDENQLILGMATTKQSQNYVGMTFIGLYSDGRQWKWTDGTVVSYNNWEMGEPNYDGIASKQLGVEMITDTITDPHASFYYAGGWNDVAYESRMRTYVCKKPAKQL